MRTRTHTQILLSYSEVKYDLMGQKCYISRDTCECE